MAYTKTNWVNNTTPINATNLNKIEDELEILDKNINYSTTEQVIGTWIDNKPLYRKVITHTYSSGSTSGSKSSGLSNLDYIEVNCVIKKLTSTTDWEKPYSSGSALDDWIRVFYRNSTNTIEIRSSSFANDVDLYIILEYTKTTD